MQYENIAQLIGGTPLLELCGYEKKEGMTARIFAKLEYFNPTGSVKTAPPSLSSTPPSARAG